MFLNILGYRKEKIIRTAFYFSSPYVSRELKVSADELVNLLTLGTILFT